MLLAFHGAAEKACDTSAGFAGEIVFLDNGEHVYPRFIAAKYPRRREDLSPSERAKRFLREMELQAASHYHPNVHWPFDVKMILDVPVAFFRRWEGDLSNYIEDESFGDLGRISLTTQLAAGLLHCHGRGLAHQDLKPENVFVRDLSKTFRDLPPDDLWLQPLVADFGSVNLAADKNEFRGTRPYMAPEQWEKKPIGEWTSVFVVGLIFHELMSRGEHPHGEHAGDWHRRSNPKFNRWQKDNYWTRWIDAGCVVAKPILDKDLAAIVADCLAPDPSSRPKLVDVRDRLLGAMKARSSTAAAQLSLFLGVADSRSSAEAWEHLRKRIALVRHAIESNWP
jgi:serine/threonine protein kinase